MKMLELLKPGKMIYWSVFIMASPAGFLNYFKLYGFSLTNWIVLGIFVMMIASLNFKNLPKITIAFTPHVLIFCFLLYGVITTLFLHNGFHDKSSLQNLFVYVSFFILLLFSTLNHLRDNYKTLNFLFLYLLAASFIIEMIELWYFGLLWGDNLTPKTVMFVDARSLSMVLLLAIGWFLSSWVVKKSFIAFLASMTGLVLIYLSLSRMALIIGICLVLLAFSIHRFHKITKEIAIFTSVLILFVLTTYFFNSPLQERYIGSTGVNTQKSHPISVFTDVGGITIDTSGREGLWSDVYNSYSDSFILGKGIGSAEKVDHGHTFSNVPSIQPCNDHLRVLHDFGLIGYFLLILQIVLWLYSLIKSYILDTSLTNRIIYLNACFAIFSLGAIAISDNPFVYTYVMLPLAIMIGSAFHQIQENRTI